MAQVVIPARLAGTVVEWEGDRGRDWLAQSRRCHGHAALTAPHLP